MEKAFWIVSSVPHWEWAVVVGILFGVALQKAKITRYETIVEVLRFKDLTVIKFMMSAVVVAMVGLHALKGLGLVKFYVAPAKLLGNVVGGFIFGLGFALFGGCPGASMAAIGDGRVDAVFGAAGILVGSWLYAEVYPYISDYLYEIGYKGKVTIPQLLGVSPWIVILPFVAGVLLMFYLFEKFGI